MFLNNVEVYCVCLLSFFGGRQKQESVWKRRRAILIDCAEEAFPFGLGGKRGGSEWMAVAFSTPGFSLYLILYGLRSNWIFKCFFISVDPLPPFFFIWLQLLNLNRYVTCPGCQPIPYALHIPPPMDQYPSHSLLPWEQKKIGKVVHTTFLDYTYAMGREGCFPID